MRGYQLYGKGSNHRRRWLPPVFFLATLCLTAGLAPAETVFVASMDGQSNVPPLPVPGTGSATLVLNDDEDMLAYHISFSGLTGVETFAHIHKGGPRENGGIVHALPLGSPKIGVWAIPADMVTELQAGRLYINIHSDIYTSGEIRGNIMLSVPTARTTWGAIKALCTSEY